MAIPCNRSVAGDSTRNRSLWKTVFIWTAQATCPVEASAKMDACAFLACCTKAVAWLQQSKATPYSFQVAPHDPDWQLHRKRQPMCA